MRKTGPTRAVVKLVMVRSGGGCERCGGRGDQIHHRIPRGMGGSRLADINAPSNLLHLCEHCHGDIESHRSAGYVYGWLVHRWDVPLSVPLKLHHGAWVFLDDLGRYVSANPEGVAA